MSSPVASRGYHGLRYRNKVCKCGETCAIKISYAKPENGGRLYYACPIDTCNMFAWCHPYRSVGTSIHANWIEEFASNNNKEVGILTPNDEVMAMVETVSELQNSISGMKYLLCTTLFLGCVIGTIELITFKKR